MTDQREKRIQEIRRSYELVKQVVPMRVPNTHMPMLEEEVDFLFEEISRLKADKQKLHNVYEAQYSRACQLQQEIEQCNEEYQSHMSGMQQEVSRLQVERDKAIEGLRWYADEGNYEEKALNDTWATYHPVRSDEGNKARSILSELGVPHETT